MIKKIFPRQIIYPSNLKKIFLRSFIPNEKLKDIFCKKFNDTFNLDKDFLCLPVNRARMGIHLILKYLRKRKNKQKVIMSSLTVFDVINMVLLADCRPIFFDFKKGTFKFDIKKLEDYLSKYNDVVAICVCHYQINSNILEIQKIAKKFNVDIIQDCSISINSKIDNKSILTYGDYSVVSFNLFKFLNSIHGGAVITKNNEFSKFIAHETANWKLFNYIDLFPYFIKGIQAKILTNICIFNLFTFNLFKFSDLYKISSLQKLSKNDPGPHLKKKIPKNYKKKMNDGQYLNLINQINNIGKFHEIRKKNFFTYDQLIKNKHFNKLDNFDDNANIGSYVNYPLFIKNELKNKFSNYLYRNKIDHAKYFYRNCEDLEIFKNFFNHNSVSRIYSNHAILLPIYHLIDESVILRNIKIINNFNSDEY